MVDLAWCVADWHAFYFSLCCLSFVTFWDSSRIFQVFEVHLSLYSIFIQNHIFQIINITDDSPQLSSKIINNRLVFTCSEFILILIKSKLIPTFFTIFIFLLFLYLFFFVLIIFLFSLFLFLFLLFFFF